MNTLTRYSGMGGGLDLITPPIERKGGLAITGYNYESRPEGYRRISGFERDDGTGLPSEANYYVQAFTAGSAAIVAGDSVVGSISGATATVLVDAVKESGDYGSMTAVGYCVLGEVSGTFQDGENLLISSVPRCLTNGTPVLSGATSDEDHDAWHRAALDTRRSLIGSLPGSGEIRGVWHFGGNLYAFRDNAGGSECVMHMASGSGWQTVNLGHQLAYKDGTNEISEGATVVGATSSATATVERVTKNAGDWTTNDQAGLLVLSGVSGTFQDGESIQIAASTHAVADGASSAISLQPGGRYEFDNHNFYGSTATKRMYGVDGVNNAFEFDGTVYTPIATGMDNDAPTHLACHRDYLVLSFAGGSVQHSSLGLPLNWQVIQGAGEIGIGDDVTALLSGYTDALLIFGRNKSLALYGRVLSGENTDADLQSVNGEVGAIEWTTQLVSKPLFFDNAGIRDIVAVQNYGNFAPSLLSKKFRPWLDKKKSNGIKPTASLVVRDLQQYWLFFDDATGLVMSLANTKAEAMPIEFDRVVRCATSVEDVDGNEVIYFGSDDGFVFRFNSGNSFDGEMLPYLVRLAFNNLGTPALKKRFKKVALELSTAAQATLLITADFSYGNPDLPSVTAESFTVRGGGGFWDTALWDQFYFSQAEGTAEAHIDGLGTNISVAIAGETDIEDPHTMHGINYYYNLRGKKR